MLMPLLIPPTLKSAPKYPRARAKAMSWGDNVGNASRYVDTLAGKLVWDIGVNSCMRLFSLYPRLEL
jgi:hypothetical protein